MLFGDLDPANNFAMGGLPMHFAKVLLAEGKPVPKTYFLISWWKRLNYLLSTLKIIIWAFV